MKLSEQNQQKILETHKFLEEIIRDPKPYREDVTLKAALISQGAMAKYNNPERGIRSCSLNTYKTVSEHLLSKGFLEIDELRIKAKSAIDGNAIKTKTSQKETATNLKAKLKEQKKQTEQDQKTIQLMILCQQELLAASKQLAFSKADVNDRVELFHELEKRFHAKMNFMLMDD